RRTAAVGNGEARPEVADRDRSEKQGSGPRVDAEGQVHHLDVVVRTYVTVGIRRIDAEPVRVEVVQAAQTLEGEQRRTDRSGGLLLRRGRMRSGSRSGERPARRVDR